MCLPRVANQTIEEDIGGSVIYNSKDGSTPVIDDNWFCPLHNCVACGALQSTTHSLRVLSIPSDLLSQLPMGIHTISITSFLSIYLFI